MHFVSGSGSDFKWNGKRQKSQKIKSFAVTQDCQAKVQDAGGLPDPIPTLNGMAKGKKVKKNQKFVG
jgi:hypothetical protein